MPEGRHANKGSTMNQLKPEEVRDLLRQVSCPGFTRDIVALGYVRSVGVQGTDVTVEFNPYTQNVIKILTMENAIRDILRSAGFEKIEVETEAPYDDQSMLLGGPSTNPLQVDLAEYGIDPNPDLIEGPNQRAKNLMNPEAPQEGDPAARAADGVDDFGALPSDGPQGNLDPTYSGVLPVYQWQIDPEKNEAEAIKINLSIGNWNFTVCWLLHPTQDLVYASLQARHWISFDGKARPNPSGRTEGVNLVYDTRREGVVAVYGTVRDFRPFVEAFRRAFAGEGSDVERSAVTEEAQA